MRTKTSVFLIASLVGFGCGSDGGGGGSQDPGQQQADSYSKTDCTDAAQNPYAGTCVETFWQNGCFAPTGTCSGEVNVELTGSSTTDISWSNGHKITTTTSYDFSGVDITMIDPNDPTKGLASTTNISILGGGGVSCATGVSKTNDQGCFQRTVYTRADGQALTFCTTEDGKTTLTCPDGTTSEIASGSGAEACQTGQGSGEACEITVNTPEPGSTGVTLPGG